MPPLRIQDREPEGPHLGILLEKSEVVPGRDRKTGRDARLHGLGMNKAVEKHSSAVLRSGPQSSTYYIYDCGCGPRDALHLNAFEQPSERR